MAENSNYPEAVLPQELAELADGDTIEKVVTIRRKGDKICLESLEGVPLTNAHEAQSTEEVETEEEPRYGQRGVKPSDYMMSKMKQT